MIDVNILKHVLEDWNYWEKQPKPSIPRKVLELGVSLEPDLVLVIQGVRRCGKSTLLAQIMQQKGLDPLHCTFVNFEDPRLSESLNHELCELILDFATKRTPDIKKRYFFFDEIQNVENWQKWLHSKIAHPNVNHFIITGSNASLLSGKLASALTGRHITLELFPFDYSEYQKVRQQGDMVTYIREGGFPRVLTYSDPERLLREYFTDIIERDVRSHVSARSTLSLTQLVKAVFEGTGSELSQRSLAGMLGVTADTIKTYLDACEASYILLSCPYFTFSERQRTARHKKYYPIDLGLRNAVVTKTGLDQGKGLETLVYHQLRKKYQRVFYWRQKGEVDFVVQAGKEITPYQVSWDGIKDRHLKALEEFYQSFPKANKANLITCENIKDFLNTSLSKNA